MTTEGKKLKKDLGVIEVFSIASGAMISSGLFVLPAVIYAKAGPSIILAYLLAAILIIPAMFSKAELATAMPKSGGTYFFIYRSLGPLFGTFAGFASWFALSLKSAFAILGIGVFLAPLLGDTNSEWTVKLIAIVFITLFTILNLLSVKESGRFQVRLVTFLILLLVLYIFSGFQHINVHRFTPFTPQGWMPVFTATGMVFISFAGLTKVASVAEEIKNPSKTIIKGMFSAFFVVTVLYLLTVFVTTGILGSQEFSETLTPISLAASKYLGKTGFTVLSIAAMLAFITTANAGLMAASRNPMAMAQDHLLPSRFSHINIRFKTPTISILTTAFFMLLVITCLDLVSLVKVASTMNLLLFSFVNISVILMRESRIVSYKPSFKSPFYPFLQIIGTLIYMILIFEMGTIPLLITSVFFIISIFWYSLYSKSRTIKESALIHIVQRITSSDLKTSTLNNELKDILIERDKIVEDRFDELIKEADIFDTDKPKNIDDLFKLLADNLATKFDMDSHTIYELLQAREKDSTTAIYPGLAVPHIIVEGTQKFNITVLRSKEGIIFDDAHPPVHIVFALAGTKDERNFHLKALMAIAQIVQNQDFMKNWQKVRNEEELRHLILLTERVRKGTI